MAITEAGSASARRAERLALVLLVAAFLACNRGPVWSPDGERVLIRHAPEEGLVRLVAVHPSDGTQRTLFESEDVSAVSPLFDGKGTTWLLASVSTADGDGSELVLGTLTGDGFAPRHRLGRDDSQTDGDGRVLLPWRLEGRELWGPLGPAQTLAVLDVESGEVARPFDEDLRPAGVGPAGFVACRDAGGEVELVRVDTVERAVTRVASLSALARDLDLDVDLDPDAVDDDDCPLVGVGREHLVLPAARGEDETLVVVRVALASGEATVHALPDVRQVGPFLAVGDDGTAWLTAVEGKVAVLLGVPPDGEGRRRIVLVRLGETEIEDSDHDDLLFWMAPAPSPDGRWIAVSGVPTHDVDPSIPDLYLVDARDPDAPVRLFDGERRRAPR